MAKKAVQTNAENFGYFNPRNVYRPEILSIELVGEWDPNDGAINTYRITQNDGKIFDFDVKNGSGGSAGRSVVSVEQIQISTESLGKNIARITLSDGTYTDVEIRNGAQGETGPQGQRGPAGIDSVEASIGTNDPTQAPSVDKDLTEGVLSLTFNNIKGAKGDQGEPAVAVDKFVTVEATDQTTAATDVLPATGDADTVYRVANWDGTQYDDTAYTEYGWYDGAYKQLATRTPGIDDEPTSNSSNLVKSGGVAAQISQLGQKSDVISSAHGLDDFVVGYIRLSDGVVSTTSGWKASGFIQCPGNISLTYVACTDNGYMNGIAFYDVNKQFISGLSNNGTHGDEITITTPQNTKYIRITILDSQVNSWKIHFSELVVDKWPKELNNGILGLSYAKIDKKPGRNLFDKDSPKIISGYYLDSSGNMQSNASYMISDFIPIIGGETYSMGSGSGAKHCFYAEDMFTVVGYTDGGNGVESPADAKYLRCSFRVADTDIFQVSKSDVALPYEPYTSNTDIQEAKTKSTIALANVQSLDDNFFDVVDLVNYIPWCVVESGVRYENGGRYVDANYDSTDIVRLDRNHNLYCGADYTSYASFYDENKQFISTSVFYYGTFIDKVNFPENAVYVRFSLQNNSGVIGVYTYDNTQLTNPSRYFTSTIKKYKGVRPVINILRTDTESQILTKLMDAYLTRDCDVYFERSTYEFDDIYGVMWNSYGVQDACELPIGMNCRYFFNGSKLIANYTGSISGLRTNSSLLGSRRRWGSYELHDATLVCNGMTYVVHDEASAAIEDYRRLYHNLHLIYNNGEDTSWISKCLGGGTGLNGVCIFENCVMESNAEIDNPQDLSYHGANSNDDGLFTLMISNCYFKNRIALQDLGTNQSARCIYNNNSSPVNPTSNPTPASGEWQVFAYNNETRQ